MELTLLLLGVMLLGAPIMLLVIFFMFRNRVIGKFLVFFINPDRTFKSYFLTPKGKYFQFKQDNERYTIDPDKTMLVKYPFGMDNLKFLQQVVPCALYAKGNPQPLDPKDVTVVPKGLTAKMVESTTNENIVAGIIAGVEKLKSKIPEWVTPLLVFLSAMAILYYIHAVDAKIDRLLGGK